MRLYITKDGMFAEEARRVGVVCKNVHVTQPEVGINISFSDMSDISNIQCFAKLITAFMDD